jgi:hypothetical protein
MILAFIMTAIFLVLLVAYAPRRPVTAFFWTILAFAVFADHMTR